MFTRVISFVLIGILLFQMGCSKTVSTIYPKPHQDPNLPLPCKVGVKLKHKTLLNGIYRFAFIPSTKKMTWQTDRISGKLVAWNDEVVSIQTPGYGGLGASSGGVFGGIIGVLIKYKEMHSETYYEWDAELARKGLLAGVLIGTVTGGILGLQAKPSRGNFEVPIKDIEKIEIKVFDIEKSCRSCIAGGVIVCAIGGFLCQPTAW